MQLEKRKMDNYLLTGAGGFLGRKIFEELSQKHNVIRLGRAFTNDVVVDLGREIPEISRPVDIVVHCAGKAHVVPKNKEEAEQFFLVNEQGTVNLLKGLEGLNPLPSTFIFISTVAVYGLTKGAQIDESFPLNGRTPYARSKINAEQAVKKWCAKNNVQPVILRLPLIVGKDAPGNLGSLTRAIKKGRYFSISGNTSRKSVVCDIDVARLIPELLNKQGIFNLTDGLDPRFVEIEEAVAKSLRKRIPFRLPIRIVQLLGKTGDLLLRLKIGFPLTSESVSKMTGTLTFSSKKAAKELGWKPREALDYIRSDYKETSS